MHYSGTILWNVLPSNLKTGKNVNLCVASGICIIVLLYLNKLFITIIIIIIIIIIINIIIINIIIIIIIINIIIIIININIINNIIYKHFLFLMRYSPCLVKVLSLIEDKIK